MNTSGVATGLGTHYNTREEELAARMDVGEALIAMDRGVYLLVHALEGVTDHARQTAVKAMLMNSWQKFALSSLDRNFELQAIRHLVETQPANRALNLLNALRADRVNNSRTKKRLILPFLLNNPNLEWWAVKYRRKVKNALEHAWGKQATGVIKATIGGILTFREQMELRARIDRYLSKKADRHKVYESIAFVLGAAMDYKAPLFQAFQAAKTDIALGSLLPPEVLEGIRSTYHKSVSQKKILELTKDTSMTEKKKALVQRKARKENVVVPFNPMARSAVELYILAYAEGMTEEIQRALQLKARLSAQAMPVRFVEIGILVDLLESDVAAVFMLTDGYENAPAGCVDEVMGLLDRMGNTTPVYQLSPAIAGESRTGLKRLSDKIPAIPVSNPQALALTLVRAMIEVDVTRGVRALAGLVRPKINTKKLV
jgi:hypothetical protein